MKSPEVQRFHKRTIFFSVFVIAAFTLILTKAFHLSFLVPPRKVYKTRGQVLRGVIYDSRDLELAVSQQAWDIGVNPSKVKDPVLTADLLGPILSISRDTIYSGLKKKKKFYYIRRTVPSRQARQVRDLLLPGVQTTRILKRVYPNARLAGALLGFTNIDHVGIEGLEKSYEEILSRPSEDANLKGHNLHLTLDSLVQYRVEQVLEKYRTVSSAKMAAALMIDVKDGSVVTMATVPGFDPNRFLKFPAEDRRNLLVRHNYEPGSTMKAFMAAILLAEGKVKPNETFDCRGQIELSDTIIKCTARHGPVNLADILLHSCNAGMIQAAARLSKSEVEHYFELFGFGHKTHIDLIGEVATRPHIVDRWDKGGRFFLPIGQGVQVTPIQLGYAFAALIGGGQLYFPRIKTHYSNSYGETVQVFKPRTKRRVVEPEVSAAIIKMLTRVVEKGTGRLGRVEGTSVLGKTGTGQIAGPGGYIKGAYTASFMAAFPAEKPRYAALVLFDRPKEPYSGGGLAAPAFAEIVRSILPLLSEEKSSEFSPVSTLKFDASRLPRDTVPDFTGKSLKESLLILHHLNHPWRLNGSGYVVDQQPAPGSAVAGSGQIILKLDMYEEP